jgi:hypothetical protein
VKTLIGSDEPPPFLAFVMEAIEKDVSRGRVGPASAPLMDGLVIHAISTPAILSLPEAIQLDLAASKLDDSIDLKLLNRLTGPSRNWPTGVPDSETTRVLEVLDETSDCRRLVLPLMKFLKLPNPRQRSKVVKLIARASQNPGWAELLLADPDPRIRSNLIDGLLLQQGPQIESLLRKAAQDPHHRVAITSLLGLCQRNDKSSCEQLRALAADGHGAHRRAAQWALSKLESNKFTSDEATTESI